MSPYFAFWVAHPRVVQVYSRRTIFFTNHRGRVTPSGSKPTLQLRNAKGSEVLPARHKIRNKEKTVPFQSQKVAVNYYISIFNFFVRNFTKQEHILSVF